MSETTNNLPAMVKSEDLSNAFATVEAGTGDKIRYSTTFDDVTLFNAINGSAEKVEDYLDKEVIVTEMVVTSADVLEDFNNTDPDGPKVGKPVTHFFTTDGKHISSISNGIRRAAENLLSVGFGPTKENPITIRFKTVKTKKGIAQSFDLVSR